MDELNAACDKLLTETYHLERALDSDDLTPQRVALAIATVKRVRRSSTLLLRLLAEHRDQTATVQEDIST